jgi:hypothetical protein
VTFAAPGSGASGTFANGTATTTATTGGDGEATARTFTANSSAGTYAVSASASAASAASFSLSNTAGAPSSVTVVSGSGQSATVGSAFSSPMLAQVTDSAGNPVSGVSVTFAAPGSGASGTFANGSRTTTATTGSDGQATASTFTANSNAGAYTVGASATGASGASFSLTNLAGPAMSVSVVSGSGQSATVGGATSGAGGTVTFKVFGPQASAPASCASGGTTVGTAAVSGSGTYNPSAGFTPSSAGTYWWYASYSGDANNGASSSRCGSAMPKTFVYSEKSVASATDTTATNHTATTSFAVQPSTTYLLLVFRHSAGGDGISSLASSGLTPSLTTLSFTSITSQTYNGSDYQWAYYVTTAGTASGTGTLTVTFKKNLGSGDVTILDLVQLGGNNTTTPIVTTNVGKASGTASTATANLPNAPAASNAEIAFLSAQQDLGASPPAATPALGNAFYSHQGAGSAGIYPAVPARQAESFSVGTSKNWGTVALEINHA